MYAYVYTHNHMYLLSTVNVTDMYMCLGLITWEWIMYLGINPGGDCSSSYSGEAL